MVGDRVNQALARIESAIARIEAASAAPRAPASQAEDAGLVQENDRLRDAVQASLRELDLLIGKIGS